MALKGIRRSDQEAILCTYLRLGSVFLGANRVLGKTLTSVEREADWNLSNAI